MESSSLDINLVLTTISTVSAVVAAYISYRAVKENKTNILLLQRNETANELRHLYCKFQIEYETFYISEYLEKQEVLMSSKYFVEPSLFEKFTLLLVKLHRLEKNSKSNQPIDDLLKEIELLFKQVLPSSRLDR
ncbi:hypothetical protein [Colwellia sp. MB02u-9]|jgi:hypothetical protein|uniref:hypothetical protein n=1 Tax=Colwellia sp. MB02u-9 TaxID=2759823 RepID=UPI0015F3F7D4|nr:hypothetical protein [Colwellia sp. MB02u-9]MBA6294826.1 hypothetical protein [Colwellia sp. MB02u-9]